EQETADALLARGADDQIGVGLAGRVKVLGDMFDVQDLGELLDGGATRGVLVQQRTYRVGDLPPSAVSDRHVDQQARVVGGGARRILEDAGGAAGQQVQRAHGVHVPALGDEPPHCILDD